VVTVKKDEKGMPAPRKFAQDYLEEHQIDAEYIEGSGYPPDVILKAANEKDIDMIIMGGYGAGTFKEIFIGSTVDRVLQSTRKPVLICK
jgi:nucleotide-binding universal stress UspA family protein